MALVETAIDIQIKNYFTNYLTNELNISEIHYELIKERNCMFKIRVDGSIENLIIKYQEDFINEYSLHFKTTASPEFFKSFLSPFLKIDTIDYSSRFNNLLNGFEKTSSKFKIFKKIILVNDSILFIRNQTDKTSGIDYNIISNTRNFSLSVNEKLYPRLKKIHYFKTIIYFTFKDGIVDADCLVINQSLENEKVDELELWISGGDDGHFSKKLRDFHKSVDSFVAYELFQHIHTHYGISFSEIIKMTEEELKPYVDIVSMIKI